MSEIEDSTKSNVFATPKTLNQKKIFANFAFKKNQYYKAS